MTTGIAHTTHTRATAAWPLRCAVTTGHARITRFYHHELHARNYDVLVGRAVPGLFRTAVIAGRHRVLPAAALTLNYRPSPLARRPPTAGCDGTTPLVTRRAGPTVSRMDIVPAVDLGVVRGHMDRRPGRVVTAHLKQTVYPHSTPPHAPTTFTFRFLPLYPFLPWRLHTRYTPFYHPPHTRTHGVAGHTPPPHSTALRWACPQILLIGSWCPDDAGKNLPLTFTGPWIVTVH